MLSGANRVTQYVTALDKDLLSIVAEYLPIDDKTRIRAIDREVRVGVDCSIEYLRTTPDSFRDILEDSSGLPRLKNVTLSDWTDANLGATAAALRRLPYCRFDLVLTQQSPCADGVAHLADLHLASLALDGVDFQDSHRNALSRIVYPISIRLSGGANSDALPASQLPTLRLINVAMLHLREAAVEALRDHQSLTIFEAYDANPLSVRRVMENPRIERAVLGKVAAYNAPDDAWLSHHPSLQSLTLSSLHSIETLHALARNPRITALSLCWPSYETHDAWAAFAHMQGLRRLSIDFFMANTNLLTLKLNCIGGWQTMSDHGGAARLASHPHIQRMDLTLYAEEETNASVRGIWEAAGKRSESLIVDISRPRCQQPVFL